MLTERLTGMTVDDIGRKPLHSLRVRAFARRALRFDFVRGDAARKMASILAHEDAAHAAPTTTT